MDTHRGCINKGFIFIVSLLLTINTSWAANNKEVSINQKCVWNQIAQGVWKVSIGVPEKVDLLNNLSISPKLDIINSMNKSSLPIEKEDINFEFVDGKTYIRFPLDKNEIIYGLGLNFKTVEQQGRVLNLHVDNYGKIDNGRTHAPVPFFVSSKGYGVLINSSRYIKMWIGTAIRKDSKNPPIIRDRNTDPNWEAQPYSDTFDILIPAEGVELVIFSGITMLDVVRRYNLFNGGGCLPPRWGLGFWQRVPSLYTDKDVKYEVEEFERKGFPLSVIGLEPGWMSKSYPCTYEWDSIRFPNPIDFVTELNERNIRTNLWINPYISPESNLYKKIEPFTGSHTVWGGLVPDYNLPETKIIMTNQFEKNQIEIGVSGYKMDENDGFDNWLWPDVATFPSGISAEQMRQTYGSIMQNFTTQIFHNLNQRTYGLVRSGNAGTSSFPYVIYSDYYNHRDYITALINSSFIGVLWTPEVRSAGSPDEWLRQMQTVCFSPIAMLNSWADGKKPWSFPTVEKDVAEVVNLRMQLIPYLYSAFADYAFFGTPPFRAMPLEDGFVLESSNEKGTLDASSNPYVLAIKHEVKDQFMVGDNLLIAPLFAGEIERTVILPKGKWFDFYTGELVGEGEIIKVRPKTKNIPIFVKDGGIIPLWPIISRIDGEKHPLEIRQYGYKIGTYYLYDDDGKSYNYEKGEFTRICITVLMNKKGKKIGKIIIPKKKKVWSFSEYNFKFMTVD